MKAETRVMAAAALAAGVNSSRAQAIVYSQNFVGYSTQSVPGLMFLRNAPAFTSTNTFEVQ